MLFKTIIYTVIFCGFQVLQAQNTTKEKEKYTKEELQSFIKIYKYTLDNPFEPLVSMQKNASKISITEARLTEIMQAQSMGYDPKLTEKENGEMSRLKKFIEEDKMVYDKKLEQYIISQKLPLEKYQEIKKLYHKDSKFQEKVNKLSL
ncbi:hypothetical protein AD998_05080 [bacterium 336/3]|nr:hypothetical protein AD998_05080 [bacterium 336/3]